MSYFLKNINDPADMDEEASAHTASNINQNSVATVDPKWFEELIADSSFISEIFEYHEVLGAAAIYEANTQKTSYYDMTIDLNVTNIDKN